MKFEYFYSIIVSVMVIAIIIVITLLVLQKLNLSVENIAERLCSSQQGKLIFYECQNSFYVFTNSTPCSELKTGYWCLLPDGSEIDLKEVMEQIKVLTKCNERTK